MNVKTRGHLRRLLRKAAIEIRELRAIVDRQAEQLHIAQLSERALFAAPKPEGRPLDVAWEWARFGSLPLAQLKAENEPKEENA